VSLSDLANIGEFVGGIAVIATLVHLAIQIRQNTRSLRSVTFQSVVDSFTDYTFELSKGTSSFATKSQPTDVMERSKGIDVLPTVPESVKGSYGGE
jgi:hypothetical protein